MSNITPFNRGGTSVARLPRQASRALADVQANGLVTAARVEAAAYVGHIALSEVGLLSMEEALVVDRCPHADARARAIVDAFTAVAATELALMSRQR